MFITGTIFSATLPVTATAIEQSPAAGSTTNGFVESFSFDGTKLNYATYITGINGDTEPTVVATDSAGHAYVAGETSASGYPALNALQSGILGNTSGFLTELTPGGDGLLFSTFVAGSGITGLALNTVSNALLLSGTIALGQFPVATANSPLTSAAYQSLVELTPDGQSLISSVVLAPGMQSHVAGAPDGSVWVTLPLSTPLLPSSIAASFEPGDGLLLHVLASGTFAQSLRIGGAPVDNAGYASLTTSLAAPAVSPDGSRVATAGTVAINLSSSLLTTQHFNLATIGVPDTLLPNSIQDVVPDPVTCGSASQCAGSGGLLTIVDPTTVAASLAVSIGDFPYLTLANPGSAAASPLSITASGFTAFSNCGTELSVASQCNIALAGSGPGSLTLSASGVTPTTIALPAGTSTPDALALSSSELDFGIVSAASSATTRTLSVTNLTGTAQTFSVARDAGPSLTSYTLAVSTSSCTRAAPNQFTVAPNGTCTLTFSLAASSSSSNDGPVRSIWKIGVHDVILTGFVQAAAPTLSSSEIDC